MSKGKDNPERARHKRRKYRRNQRRRVKLMRQGMTEDEARALIIEEGRMLNALYQERMKEDARSIRPLRDAEHERHPKQPNDPQSVRDFPAGGFETNRRKH